MDVGAASNIRKEGEARVRSSEWGDADDDVDFDTIEVTGVDLTGKELATFAIGRSCTVGELKSTMALEMCSRDGVRHRLLIDTRTLDDLGDDELLSSLFAPGVGRTDVQIIADTRFHWDASHKAEDVTIEEDGSIVFADIINDLDVGIVIADSSCTVGVNHISFSDPAIANVDDPADGAMVGVVAGIEPDCMSFDTDMTEHRYILFLGDGEVKAVTTTKDFWQPYARRKLDGEVLQMSVEVSDAGLADVYFSMD